MTDIATDETLQLIASDKVEGTAVYNPNGDRLGTISNLMVDKLSGQVDYAVMSFGGFLGIGEKQHPLPWSSLTYDEDKGGYVVNLDKKKLENAPTLDPDEDFEWTPDYGRSVDKYYGAPTYW
jgi:sporulation protein YlmC with PRC-barrel domain